MMHSRRCGKHSTSLSRVALGQNLPHVQDNGEIGLEDLPAVIQLLEASFGEHDCVTTAKWNTQEIKQLNPESSQYYAEFRVIVADHDWNPSPMQNAPKMELYEEMQDLVTNSNMPEEPPAFVRVCQKQNNQIRQP